MSRAPLRFSRGSRRLLLSVLLLVGIFLLFQGFTHLYIESLWFETAGYSSVFWKRTLWQWGLRAIIAVVTALLVLANFRVVGSTVGVIQIRRRVGDMEILERIPTSYLTRGSALAAVVIGLWFGAAVPPGTGVRTLLFFNASTWGVTDPVLGRDLSFYVFTLPILRTIIGFALVVLLLLIGVALAAYLATGTLSWKNRSLVLPDRPRVHLGSLLAILFLLLAAWFWTVPHFLLVDGNSAVHGIFGFTDAEARLPGYQALVLLSIAAAVAVILGAIRKRGTLIASAVAAVFFASLVLTQLYPSVIQRFRVEPNELDRESPYITHNIAFTRIGFALDHLQRDSFDYVPPDRIDRDEALRQISGYPVWSVPALLTTFNEIEARFRYYDFSDVAIDRYRTGDGLEPAAVSVREVDPSGIEDPTWQNLHIRKLYIAGRGAVVSAATRRTENGRPAMTLSGLPPEVTPGSPGFVDMELTHPWVYFGSKRQLYAILNPGEEILEDGEGRPRMEGVDFPPGIRLNSFLRTLTLAWRFRDTNLLFSSEISDSSRFIFRRDVMSRARTVAPFLHFFEDPYPVVSGGRISWILDGFTGTRHFPLASPRSVANGRRLSYLRSSVKITMDGVTGAMRFYVIDDRDPLLRSLAKTFPGLFRPVSEMPIPLREHIRYPRQFLDVQAQVLAQYHQDTPRRFHGQQDLWARPEELAEGSRPVPYRPEYGYYRFPGEVDPAFLLTTVFVPVGRQNLTAVLAARSDADRYGDLLLLDVPVADQVSGPRQVEALVEQDPTISEQFSLWRQGGSQVHLGHLHVVPVGKTLLYMEPVFLAAEKDAIPELRRFVVSDGQRVTMMPTLEEAVTALFKGTPGSLSPESQPAPVIDEGIGIGRALDLLNEAEASLREGDWSAFGEALARLRVLLERLSGGGEGDAP